MTFKKLLLFFLIFASSKAAVAADLFDLQVLPLFASDSVRINGTIVKSSHKTDTTSRRNNFSGLMNRWLASATVTISTGSNSTILPVSDGDFSGTIPVESLASFSISVFYQQELLHQESLQFRPQPDFLIISDIDDTILESEVSSKLNLVYNSLLIRYENRVAIKGTSKIYCSLNSASSTLGLPHFIYLSSSPSFLSRPIKRFLSVNQFPMGSVILKKSLFSGDHENHKTGWLEQITQIYPNTPLMLFGDSGEQDPEIYSNFASSLSKPGLIKAIFIRQISDDKSRLQELASIRLKMQKINIPMRFWSSDETLRSEIESLNLLMP